MKVQGRIGIVFGLLFSLSTFASEPNAVPGEYVVKMKSNIMVQSTGAFTLAEILGSAVKSRIPDSNIVVVKRPAIELAANALKELNANPFVEIAEPNFIYKINKVPNDPLLGNLWGMSNTGQKDSANHVGIAGVDIDAVRAWDITTGSKDVIVAVIDTGVGYTHPDLVDNMWINEVEAAGKAGVDDDANGYIDDIHGMNFVDATKPTNEPLDDHGHGSHCSGTIGASGDDGKGIVGVNWHVRIMPVKFLSAEGSGTLEGAILGINYATKMGARIMSNSWGGGDFSQTLKDAIDAADAAGILFLAAAGNDSNNNDTNPSYPAAYTSPNVLAVAAIDNQGNMANFSNYGKKTVHVAAPGVNVYSSVLNGGYDSWSGTSMATPHVSGVAALVAANEPNLTGLQIKERIIATSRPISGTRGKVVGGLVSAYNAVTNTVPGPDVNDPAFWASNPLAISSPHPYANKYSQTFEVSVRGAKEISLYFAKFDTESSFDTLTFLDKNGKQIAQMSGSSDDSFTQSIPGDYVKLVFKSDDSVTKYGFDLTKVAYR